MAMNAVSWTANSVVRRHDAALMTTSRSSTISSRVAAWPGGNRSEQPEPRRSITTTLVNDASPRKKDAMPGTSQFPSTLQANAGR